MRREENKVAFINGVEVPEGPENIWDHGTTVGNGAPFSGQCKQGKR